MARVVPNALGKRLQFFMSHAPQWVANAASIGLTPTQAANVQALTDEAIAAHEAQVAAMEAAKAATQRYQSAMEKLTDSGTAAVATIKAFADTSGAPAGVYGAAQIDLPKQPTRRTDRPLARPTSPSLVVKQDGVTFMWKAKISDGRYFEVYRSLDYGRPVLLTTVHGKTIMDGTVPPGTKTVGYSVVAVKGHRRSESTGTSLHLYGAFAATKPGLRVA